MTHLCYLRYKRMKLLVYQDVKFKCSALFGARAIRTLNERNVQCKYEPSMNINNCNDSAIHSASDWSVIL